MMVESLKGLYFTPDVLSPGQTNQLGSGTEQRPGFDFTDPDHVHDAVLEGRPPTLVGEPPKDNRPSTPGVQESKTT